MYVMCERQAGEGGRQPGIRCGWPACWAMHLCTQALICANVNPPAVNSDRPVHTHLGSTW
jgi:hypothetical protein